MSGARLRDAAQAAEAERLLGDPSPLVHSAAIWALGRLDRARLQAHASTRREVEDDPDVLAEWDGAAAG